MYFKTVSTLLTKGAKHPSNLLWRSCNNYSKWSPVNSCKSHSHTKRLLSSRTPWEKVESLKVDKITNKNEKSNELEDLFKPIEHEDFSSCGRSGEELCGRLNKSKVIGILNKFYIDPGVRATLQEYGINDNVFRHTVKSFRDYCAKTSPLPTDLHILFYDLSTDGSDRHLHELFPFFLKHAEEIFPHLKCMDDLSKISDLGEPLYWFPDARTIKRKIVFHSGPTNSGKTHHAMERFLAAKSGRYHGPLKMLAVEMFQKSNERGVPCDLLTGEERRFAVAEDLPSSHTASTVEMAVVNEPCEVAIIDEIQMIANDTRGWAWTRALLGVPAKEVHVCGEGSAIEVVRQLCQEAGDDFEVRHYKRLTKLTVEKRALESLDNIRSGDCIVCFTLKDIHEAARHVEKNGHEVAIIYGDLPPGTKNAQSAKFNDPNHKCDVMVATDAIGMGINLSIRRIIFYSLMKVKRNELGEKDIAPISVSQALQIAGRAGRYGTRYEQGFVTSLRQSDMRRLGAIMDSVPPLIEQVGLRPTADQIELFAYHLRNYDLSQLVDIFVKVCTIDDSNYFMCHMTDFKNAAVVIKDLKLTLKDRYVFCHCPVNFNKSFCRFMMHEFAKQYSMNIPVDYACMQRHLKWPFEVPENQSELIILEEAHDVLSLYFWLSYRFEDLFPARDLLREVQEELDAVILEGVTILISRLGKDDDKSSQLHNKLKSIRSKNEYANTKAALKKFRDRYDNENQSDPKSKGVYESINLKNLKFIPKKKR